MIKVLKPVMCWFLILLDGKKRKQALWWQKIVTFAPPPKLFCLYNHTPLFFCFQLCFTQILAGVSRKSEIADPFYWAADAAFFSFSLATKKETKMAARFYVNNFTIRFFLVACCATLHPAMSVRWSVGRSPFYFFGVF